MPTCIVLYHLYLLYILSSAFPLLGQSVISFSPSIVFSFSYSGAHAFLFGLRHCWLSAWLPYTCQVFLSTFIVCPTVHLLLCYLLSPDNCLHFLIPPPNVLVLLPFSRAIPRTFLAIYLITCAVLGNSRNNFVSPSFASFTSSLKFIRQQFSLNFHHLIFGSANTNSLFSFSPSSDASYKSQWTCVIKLSLVSRCSLRFH